MTQLVVLVATLSALLLVLVVAAQLVDFEEAQLLLHSNASQQDGDSGDPEMVAAELGTTEFFLLNGSVTYDAEELNNMNTTVDVLVNDVQNTTTRERETKVVTHNRTNTCNKGSCVNWTQYHRLADIYDYLDYLQETFPQQVSVQTVGYSAEQRPIRVVKISTDTNKTSKAVWVDGGIHAREWITPAATTYIIHAILTSLQANESTFLGLHYYILPVMNPDGYEYSHTTNRFWRKNRSSNNDSDCIGTDLNRNWDHKWGGKGSTIDPCSSNYRGVKAFSESETASVSSYILNRTSEILAYLSLHSFGQKILFPWAYTYSRTEDYKELYSLAYKMSDKVKTVSGASYRVGTAAETYYIASGGSQDWAKAEAKIKYSYTMELRDTGKFAFFLPVEQILETSKDAFAAFTVLSEEVKR